MCFDVDSSPPIPMIAGAAVSQEPLTLVSSDGASFAAFLATPDGPSDTGVAVLPDVRGLYRFYEELALRFAEHGYPALAIDYFGRTAGATARGEDFDYPPHVQATTDAAVQEDIGAALAELRRRGAMRLFTVGFCYGGRASWFAAADHDLAGAVGFYGHPTRVRDGGSVVARAGDLRCPVLALQAGDDQGISQDDNNAFRAALESAGVRHELIVYEGAPHSFFDRKQAEFADASADAWRRTRAFIDAS